MKFLWPEALWLLLVAPVLVGAYVAAAAAQEERARCGTRALACVKAAIGPGQRLPPPRAAARLFLLALIGVDRRDRASERRHHAAVRAAHHHPRDRRLAEHARDRHRAEPASRPRRRRRRRSSRSSRPTCASASCRSPARRRSCSRRRATATTWSRRSTASQLQRHTAIGSGIIVSLATLFPDEGIDLESRPVRRRRRRATRPRRRAARQARRKARQKQAVQAGAARVVRLRRDHPAHRRPPHDRAPIRSTRRAWPPTAACASTRSASAPPRAARPTSTACRSTCASTRRR